MFDSLDISAEILWWAFAISVAMFVGTLIVVPILICRMPNDYFLYRKPPPSSWPAQHPALRWTVLILKNFLGAVLVVAGISMTVLPGQGLLTILIGVTLLNFPGKTRLELAVIRQKPVLRAVNWIRLKGRRPPLQLPEPTKLLTIKPRGVDRSADETTTQGASSGTPEHDA